nr:hypothetical protein C45E1.4 - Caenorhabditis elegans [Caenorhabditis elegans]
MSSLGTYFFLLLVLLLPVCATCYEEDYRPEEGLTGHNGVFQALPWTKFELNLISSLHATANYPEVMRLVREKMIISDIAPNDRRKIERMLKNLRPPPVFDEFLTEDETEKVQKAHSERDVDSVLMKSIKVMEMIWIHHLHTANARETFGKKFFGVFFPETCPSKELEELQQKRKWTCCTMEIINFEVKIYSFSVKYFKTQFVVCVRQISKFLESGKFDKFAAYPWFTPIPGTHRERKKLLVCHSFVLPLSAPRARMMTSAVCGVLTLMVIVHEAAVWRAGGEPTKFHVDGVIT